ncbi:MAG TPA: enoyl-ACP reductase [Thermoflexales bacterium]|nr:enoyl-ACP reductase [Thermoflexales bacterium]HQW34288.1 enoyl-ACP reductase [Thermoflexales bacterium]HQZ21798.1 enoyl-ACP reductase [Thermoflexales bacterium]
MGILTGKKVLIFGVANDHSIAWGIAQAMHREGAELGFSYAGEKLERRVRPLAESLGSTFVEPCDVGNDADIAAVMAKAKAHFGELDILIHSVAFAGRDDLMGAYHSVSREGFRMAMDISVYSFTALAREAYPIMKPGGAMLTLTYIGSVRAVPHYNVMGVAKAALEASVRYLAADFGAEEKHVRVNAISAGPIRTLAVAGIAGSRALITEFAKSSLLRRNITIEDVGNSAAYLCSDMAAGVTGEIHYVDAGFNVAFGATEGE